MQVTLTLDVPPGLLAQLIADQGKSSLRTKAAMKIEPSFSDTKPALHFKPGQGRGKTPKLPSPASYYRRQKGDVEGAVRGHRHPALNLAGMKVAWSLYNQGYSLAEIARAFRGVASYKAITITIRNIAGSTKEV